MRKTWEKIKNFTFFYEISVFIVLFLTMAFNISVSDDSYYFSFFLLDYSHGYMTRGFIGEVVSLFTDRVTESLVFWIVAVVSFILIVTVSLLFGKAIKSCSGDKKNAMIIMVGLLVFSPMTFSWLFKSGMQSDLYLFTLTLLAVLFVKNRYLRWFIPVLCVLATLVSVVYSVHCMVLIAIILLYEFSKNKSASNGIMCAVTYVGIIAVSLYAIASRDNLTYKNVDELMAHMLAKTNLTEFEPSIVFYFEEYLLPLKYAINKYMIDLVIENLRVIVFGFIFIYLPVAVLFGIFWGKCIKVAENKLQGFVYFLGIAALLLPCLPAVFTGEPGRWLGASFVIQFGLLMYMLADKNKEVSKVFDSMLDSLKTYSFLLIIPLLYYSMIGTV